MDPDTGMQHERKDNTRLSGVHYTKKFLPSPSLSPPKTSKSPEDPEGRKTASESILQGCRYRICTDTVYQRKRLERWKEGKKSMG